MIVFRDPVFSAPEGVWYRPRAEAMDGCSAFMDNDKDPLERIEAIGGLHD